jgi:hypothetical protein
MPNNTKSPAEEAAKEQSQATHDVDPHPPSPQRTYALPGYLRSFPHPAKGDRSEAMLSYPALSGEWEVVPVTRNAKITPVNEGVGGITFGGVPRYP